MNAPASAPIHILEAERADASEIADIFWSALLQAIPDVDLPYNEEETRDLFARTVSDIPAVWWIARSGAGIEAYMALYGEHLDHLYVRPAMQRRRLGSALLDKAKLLSPRRLELRTVTRNKTARAFYEAHGFEIEGFSDDENEVNEPEVRYVWRSA